MWKLVVYKNKFYHEQNNFINSKIYLLFFRLNKIVFISGYKSIAFL